MAKGRELKGRIKSVEGTRKITRTMEMVATSKLKRAQDRVVAARPYAQSLAQVIADLYTPELAERFPLLPRIWLDVAGVNRARNQPQVEIAALTEEWKRQGEPEFVEKLLEEVEPAVEEGGGEDGFDPDEDPLLGDAIRLVAEMQTASTSMLQRRLRVGYTRAGRLIDMLERRGVISGYEGSKPRSVLISETDVPRVVSNLAEAGRLGGARATVLDPDPVVEDEVVEDVAD